MVLGYFNVWYIEFMLKKTATYLCLQCTYFPHQGLKNVQREAKNLFQQIKQNLSGNDKPWDKMHKAKVHVFKSFVEC